MTSEMFLSILTLLQNNLPCSVNYYRYKQNYEKYVGEESGNKDGKGEEESVTYKTIASPRLMSKLSPVSQFVANNNINVNPISQKGLLKYAMNKDKPNKEIADGGDSDTDGDQDFAGFKSKNMTKEEKAKREKELEELKANGKD